MAALSRYGTCRPFQWGWLSVVLLLVAGCDSAGSGPAVAEPTECSIDTNLLADGGPGKDGIPALTDPALVAPDAISYLDPDDRVIGLRVGDRAIAVPHNILWWHEIANFTFGDLQLAVTYCPLTGSSIAFDRAAVGGAAFGVSGLLFQNNLTMYDRRSDESLWPQMLRRGGCGSADQQPLPMYPVVEMEWGDWQAMHPGTEVITGETGIYSPARYTSYPYAQFNYEAIDNDLLLFDMPIDPRRPPKERVLGVPDGAGGVAFPFGSLDDGGAPVRTVAAEIGGAPLVVFWDRAARGAMAYRPTADGQSLIFEVQDGAIRDTDTGSTWRLDGTAVDGPLAGTRLEPVAEAYIAFWFAWAAFQPETAIWSGS